MAHYLSARAFSAAVKNPYSINIYSIKTENSYSINIYSIKIRTNKFADMKTKLLKKFRKRFIVERDPGTKFLVLIDMWDKKVYHCFVSGYKLRTLQQAIYLGVSKILGYFELADYWEARKRREYNKKIKKHL